MKKKLYTALVLLLGVMAFSACTTEVDDVFDKESTQRAQEAMESTKNVLTVPKNGWRMAYYGDTSYGGFNVFMKFTDDSVVVASEKVGASQNAGLDADGKLIRCTSHYKLEQSQGVVLSLDEYNDVFHYFADPNNTDQGMAGEGFYGDFEFRVLSATADKIVLTGKKHGSKIVMYAMDENTSWEDYYNEVVETEDYMNSLSYAFTNNGDTLASVGHSSIGRRLVFYHTDETGESVATGAPYIVTPEGYELYDSVSVGGVAIGAIEKGSTDEYFCVKGNEAARLETYVTPWADALRDGIWYIKYDDLGTYAQSYWQTLLSKLGTAGSNGERNRLYWAFIGTYNSRSGFHMQAGSDYTYQILSFESNEDGTEVTIKWKSADNNKNATNRNYYTRYGVKEAIEPFCMGTRGRTFSISSDSRRHPTYLKLTEKGNEENTITLWFNSVMYPFGDLDAETK